MYCKAKHRCGVRTDRLNNYSPQKETLVICNLCIHLFNTATLVPGIQRYPGRVKVEIIVCLIDAIHFERSIAKNNEILTRCKFHFQRSKVQEYICYQRKKNWDRHFTSRDQEIWAVNVWAISSHLYMYSIFARIRMLCIYTDCNIFHQNNSTQ